MVTEDDGTDTSSRRCGLFGSFVGGGVVGVVFVAVAVRESCAPFYKQVTTSSHVVAREQRTKLYAHLVCERLRSALAV